jgi:glutathione synthase/RimK-type ligase-like ATP-grasp enzyme
MKLGIVTCSEFAGLTKNDSLLVPELEKLGIEASPLIWTDPLAPGWDAILVRSPWDYYHHTDKFRAWMKKAHASTPLLLNSLETMEWNIDKTYLREIPSAIPSLFLGRSEPEALEKIQKSGWREIVVKPCVSGGAFLTWRTSSDHPELAEKIREIQKYCGALVQPYFSSIAEEGEISLIFFRGKKIEFSHAVLKVPKSGDFRVQIDFGGSEELVPVSETLKSFSLAALEKVPGDWVFARVDLVDWKTRPLVNELELIEPNLFFSHDEKAAGRLASALKERLAAFL